MTAEVDGRGLMDRLESHSGLIPTALVPAVIWHGALAADAASQNIGGNASAICEFSNTPRAIDQPALAEDIICLHGGGPKRVHRVRGRSHSSHDIDCGALTMMPRGQCNGWLTFGPIGYVHLTLGASLVEAISREEFDCERQHMEFRDDVGFRDPLVEGLFGELRQGSRWPRDQRLYTDSLLAALTGRLLLTRSTLTPHRVAGQQRSERSAIKGGLPGWRLRRIADYLRDHLAEDVPLDRLSGMAGLSRAQFFRAFRQSTGTTPARYFAALRIEHARELVSNGCETHAAARATGFSTSAGLDAAFRRSFGQTTRQFIRSRK